MCPCIVINFLKQNQLDALISQICFWNQILHVSNSSSVHHQEFFTVHTAMVYVKHVCWQLASRSICSCSPTVSKPVWHIPLLYLQWKSPDDGHRNCPKHVEIHSKNKFEKLVHLVGFILRNKSFTIGSLFISSFFSLNDSLIYSFASLSGEISKASSRASNVFFVVFLSLLPFPVSFLQYCVKRHFLCKMWPIIICKICLSSLTLCNTSSFLTWLVQLISVLLQHHI